MAQDTCNEFLPLNTVFDSSYTIFLVLISTVFLLLSIQVAMFGSYFHLLRSSALTLEHTILAYFLHVLNFAIKM